MSPPLFPALCHSVVLKYDCSLWQQSTGNQTVILSPVLGGSCWFCFCFFYIYTSGLSCPIPAPKTLARSEVAACLPLQLAWSQRCQTCMWIVPSVSLISLKQRPQFHTCKGFSMFMVLPIHKVSLASAGPYVSRYWVDSCSSVLLCSCSWEESLLKDVGLASLPVYGKMCLVSASYKYLCIASTLRKVLLCTLKHKSCLYKALHFLTLLIDSTPQARILSVLAVRSELSFDSRGTGLHSHVTSCQPDVPPVQPLRGSLFPFWCASVKRASKRCYFCFQCLQRASQQLPKRPSVNFGKVAILQSQRRPTSACRSHLPSSASYPVC